MNIPVDIHTHRLPQVPGTAIANCYPETFSPQSGGWYSVGIHPWHIGRSGGEHSGVEGAVASRVCGLEELVRHPQVLAVGEAGLDKLADAPMDLQVEVFRCQACLAEEVGKPLVIHLVCRVPADRLFIETDESEVSIGELYARAAEVRGISPEELGETLRRNVCKVFFKP